MVSSLVMALLLLSLFAFVFTLQTAGAQSGIISINPNGSISSPVPANITTSDNSTYTFTGNNYLPIVVLRSNIIINGMDHTLQAPEEAGFSLSGVSNVTIKNTTVTDSMYGIYLFSSSGDVLSGNNLVYCHAGIWLDSSSDNNTLSGNNAAASYMYGIYLDSSYNNTLSDNKVTNSYGLYLSASSGNVLCNNTVADGAFGIWLDSSSGNVLSGNVMADNSYNFLVFGSVLKDFVNNVSTSNLVNGKPVYYLMSKSNIVISPQTYPAGVGYLGIVNCANVTVQGMTLTHNGEGLLLANTTNSKITHNSVTANGYDGIDLYYSSRNVLSGNNVTANLFDDGIYLEYSSGNVLSGNHITANGYDGIDQYSSDNNTLSGNNVTANGYDGIDLEYSSDNVLSGNNATANGYGAPVPAGGIYLFSSSGNVLSGNVMAGNTYNFVLFGITLSDFVNNVSTSNLVDGKPVYYLINQSNIVISPQTCPEGVGYVGLVNCENVTVQGMTLTHNGEGLLLANTNDSRITHNNATANIYGIGLTYSSDNNTLVGNSVTANSWGGIYLVSSSGNALSGNNISGNRGDGVYIVSSSNNMFFHNNFINNTYQVSSDGSPNTWNNGYPSGGNYWSNYLTKYPNATENDGSAIWSMHYFIDANNTDYYPLMGPFSTFGVGTWNGTAYSVDTVSNSTITNVSFNASAKALTFNVTGPSSTVGFCRIAIPRALMWCGNETQWSVVMEGSSGSLLVLSYHHLSIMTDANYTYIYFAYAYNTPKVIITSTNAIPEFQPYMLLPLLMMITLLAAMVSKRKRRVKK